MRVVECAEMKSLRLTGSRSGLSTFWFDLQFEDEDEYVIFSQSMPQVGVTRVCKSRSEMTKILGKPLYPGVVPPEQDEEISLLEANQRRRADEPSHRLTMPESRLPRKRLSHGLQSTVVEDNAAKKPRIHVAESELNEGEMGSRPPVSHQRRTRRSLYTNSEDPFRDLSPARL
ncbi:hypothetical protein BU16DRAFT_350414 [Lophium mytilinum]|uniref:Uncharacterized protein n=1 Tax=Lophium mytilinum TaxID=390894 RepID=A0A6A6QY38_9PEZI|nr:hypothetical protein BU16DRAFT_350414 [Lophium mytilinum]